MEQLWMGKRYYSLNSFLRNKFNKKVFKISIDGGFSCPNRDGTISYGGCIFCSERGSGDFAGSREKSIKQQIIEVSQVMEKKWKEGAYIAYFQAYTNTYGEVETLKRKYEEAINCNNVIGLAIATRPDCLSNEILDLLEEFSQKIYTWVELGLQTSNEETAVLINRGYKLETFEKAMASLKSRGIPVVVHAILGLPKETEDDMLNTIKYIGNTGAFGIKIHLLHLIKFTPLVELYHKGELKFLEFDEYVNIVTKALTLLPETMVIHRLTGDAKRSDLIGPMWSLKKWEVLNAIDKKMEQEELYQGLYYCTK